MNIPARDEYLVGDVLSAPPQKLKLMLIEGAIRFGQRAARHWELDQLDQAGAALLRCQDIMSELLSGLSESRDTDLGQRLAAIYIFVSRCFADAHAQRDTQKLADALQILNIERETWQQVCAQLGAGRKSIPAPHAFGTEPASRISFEA